MATLAAELRDRLKLRYAADCKCGQCSLVPDDLIRRAAAALDAAQAPTPRRTWTWLWWKFVHNGLVHPWLALPWEPRWAQRAHDWTAQRCVGGG